MEFVVRVLAIMGSIYLTRTFIFGIQMQRLKQGKREHVRCSTCGHIHERKED